jgi:hypothetical protein
MYKYKIYKKVLTNSMEQSSSWEANSHSAGQNPPSHPVFLRSLPLLYSYLRIGLPRGLFPSDVSTQILCAFLTYAVRAARPAHLIRIDFRVY